MKSIATASLVVFLASPVLYAQSLRGTVCIAPLSPERPTIGSPGGFYDPATFTVRIDKEKPIIGPHKDFIKIGDLDLSKRHLAVFTSNGKPIQSVWFKFSDFKDSDLCLSFDSYSLVQLTEKRESPWCKCK